MAELTGVRYDKSRTVHQLAANTFSPHPGRVYAACCGRKLYREQGAMLTTRSVTCPTCTDITRPAAFRDTPTEAWT